MVAPRAELRHRTRALLDALERDQGIPVQTLRHQLDEYPETVRVFFVCAWEGEGVAGFLDAFRLVDLLENLGCRDLAVPTPDRLDPVCLVGRRRDGKGFCVEVSRGARNLDRSALLRILKEELGIERATRSITVIRPRLAEQSGRDLSPRAAVGGAGPAMLDATAGPEIEAPVPVTDLIFSGKLTEMPFPDLVQLLGMQRKTGALRFGHGGRQVGAVYFKDGEVVHATFRGGHAGERAFRRCAALREAFFAFTTETPPVRSIRRTTQTVLLDAMRAIDEQRRV